MQGRGGGAMSPLTLRFADAELEAAYVPLFFAGRRSLACVLVGIRMVRAAALI